MRARDACHWAMFMLRVPVDDAAADSYAATVNAAAAAAAAALTHCSGSQRLLQRTEGRDSCAGFLSGSDSRWSVICGRLSLCTVGWRAADAHV